MATKGWKRRLALLLCGAMPLVTTANCDPRRGTFDFFRDDDAGFFFDDFGHDEVFFVDEFDDCFFFFDCF